MDSTSTTISVNDHINHSIISYYLTTIHSSITAASTNMEQFVLLPSPTTAYPSAWLHPLPFKDPIISKQIYYNLSICRPLTTVADLIFASKAMTYTNILCPDKEMMLSFGGVQWTSNDRRTQVCQTQNWIKNDVGFTENACPNRVSSGAPIHPWHGTQRRTSEDDSGRTCPSSSLVSSYVERRRRRPCRSIMHGAGWDWEPGRKKEEEYACI